MQVTLLEQKHGDLLCDFLYVIRTTMRLLTSLGCGNAFAALPLQRGPHGHIAFEWSRGDPHRPPSDLHQPYPYVAMVPQWDLLNLLAEAAQAEPSLRCG